MRGGFRTQSDTNDGRPNPMDISAASEGRASEEIERRDGSTQANNALGIASNGEVGSQRDEHQFQTAISAWRSKMLSRYRQIKLMVPVKASTWAIWSNTLTPQHLI